MLQAAVNAARVSPAGRLSGRQLSLGRACRRARQQQARASEARQRAPLGAEHRPIPVARLRRSAGQWAEGGSVGVRLFCAATLAVGAGAALSHNPTTQRQPPPWREGLTKSEPAGRWSCVAGGLCAPGRLRCHAAGLWRYSPRRAKQTPASGLSQGEESRSVAGLRLTTAPRVFVVTSVVRVHQMFPSADNTPLCGRSLGLHGQALKRQPGCNNRKASAGWPVSLVGQFNRFILKFSFGWLSVLL